MSTQKERSFDSLLKDLQVACESHDWDTLGALDVLLKQKLEKFVGLAKNDAQKETLKKLLLHVQKIYELMREQGETHKKELSEQFRQLSKEQKAVNSYLDSAGL